MDITERKNHKDRARSGKNWSCSRCGKKGVGTAEIDLIHAVRHHPGCTQAQLAELLHADKAAIARRTKNLEAKGLLIRRDAPSDRRSQLLYPTKKAESLRSSKAEIEAAFLRIPDQCAHRRGSRCLCRCAEQAVHSIQDREPRGLTRISGKLQEVRLLMKKDKTFRPDRVLSYFKAEWLPLVFVTLSGLVYNIGLLATPWFEGRLAQCLADILGGSETAAKNGHAGAGLYRGHAGGAGGALYQALLCPPLCQQHQPPDEGHPVCQSGAAEPGGAGKRRRR